MNCVVRGRDAPAHAVLGGKARALLSLEICGFPVPAWFAVTPSGFDRALTDRQREEIARSSSPEEFAKIASAVPPDQEVLAEIVGALRQLGGAHDRFAVRSSAIDEDNPEHSFAGQLDSFLFVPATEVPDKIAAVWQSAFSERILAYRRERGVDPSPKVPAVIVQRMINSEASGVAFGADPVTGRRGVAVVAAVFGLGTALVSGDCDSDTYEVDRDGKILSRKITKKTVAHRFDPTNGGGFSAIPLTDQDATRSVLADLQVREVADLVRRSEKHFGRPQDIEWAYESGRLYLLQSRPITSLANLPDPDGALNLWDNSNITESYGGVTTPLTFSFARSIYEGVYREFCRIMHVPEEVITANDRIFARMLGLIRGRVYYNLLSWYRVLAMLPGFRVNRRFMEQMMGVREPLPDEIVEQLSGATAGDRFRDAARLARTLGGLAWNHFVLNRKIKQFHARLKQALAPPQPGLNEMRADELAAHYLELERRLLTRWDAPLVNDFFAMIFHGLLRGLTERWCGNRDGRLAADLVRGNNAMISIEPAERVRRMAALVSNDDAFRTLLCKGAISDILEGLESRPQFQAEYRNYIEKFGDRCLEELKLESSTLHDDPIVLFHSVGQLADTLSKTGAGSKQAIEPSNSFERACAEARKALGWDPVRRVIFFWVLGNARRCVTERENLRFQRTLLFGRVRRIFLEIGKRLEAGGILGNARDIFYLEIEEVLGFIQGTATTVNLKPLVSLRKEEFEKYRASEPPDDRFETRGIVYQGNSFRRSHVSEKPSEDERRGTGCCPGVVRGPVCVVKDPRTARLIQGNVLVAERTDPGWVLLFPFAAGLLVERGSLLSHSAIVAREMGIPAIVSIPGVTTWLKDGDWVELDGAAGVVRRIPPEEHRSNDQ
jgi:rifampicin phosphotransferase